MSFFTLYILKIVIFRLSDIIFDIALFICHLKCPSSIKIKSHKESYRCLLMCIVTIMVTRSRRLTCMWKIVSSSWCSLLSRSITIVARKRNKPFCMNMLRNTQHFIVGCFFVINFVYN